ncbi:MAG: DNA primase [Candidatus Paceibacterota bacterium]|jgi:DNA primase
MLDSPVDEIKAKLSIEDVLSGYLHLQRAGRNLKAKCPFHNEKTPSFMVSPERQFWHCFGCNEGGDIFTFIMKMEGLEFKDAIKLLAERAGVKLKTVNYSSSGKKGKIMEILKLSKRFYMECLKIKTGLKAYEYLRDRGLTMGSIEKFELGYAPDSWDILSKFLKKKGYSESEIFDSGLSVKKDNGGFYDRFRGRIMFPINNISGQTIGYSSRIMPGKDESQAKYINTPETLVYNKSSVLYGLDKAKMKLRTAKECIMVEGNMDVIASHQAGVDNVVATSGTALTDTQLRIIKRYTDNINFAFDVDSAGIKAAKRGIELAIQEGMNVGIIQVPEGKDPADCVKSDPKLWQDAAMKPKKIMEFYFDVVFAKNDRKDVEGKKVIAKELIGIIAKIANKIEQSYYIQSLSQRLDVEESILIGMLRDENKTKEKDFNIKKNKNEFEINKLNQNTREAQLQERLMGFIVLYPQYFKTIFPDLEGLFEGGVYEEIFSILRKYYDPEKGLTPEVIKTMRQLIRDEAVMDKEKGKLLEFKLEAASLRVETELENSDEDASREMANTISTLRIQSLKNKNKRLEEDIKSAVRNGDMVSVKPLMEEQDRNNKEIGALEA